MKRQITLFLLMIAVAIPSLAQMVTGKVTDALDDEPMEQAQIWYKDKPNGKILSDANGNYKIRFRPGTLVFHAFGYQDVEVVVKKARVLNVKLSMNAKEMKAVTGIDRVPLFSPVIDDYYSGMVVTIQLYADMLSKKETPESLQRIRNKDDPLLPFLRRYSFL